MNKRHKTPDPKCKENPQQKHSTSKSPLKNFPEDSKNRRFILLDTETTGLDIKIDRLISINAVEMINGELTGIQFNAYLHNRQPGRPRPLLYYLADYNYSRKDNIKKSLITFLNFVNECTVITHNAAFDMKFINAELERCELPIIPVEKCICTLNVFRNLKKIGKIDKNLKLRLCDLCSYYNIKIDAWDLHQGIVDAIIFGRVVCEMIKNGVGIENYEGNTDAKLLLNYSTIGGYEMDNYFDGDNVKNEEIFHENNYYENLNENNYSGNFNENNYNENLNENNYYENYDYNNQNIRSNRNFKKNKRKKKILNERNGNNENNENNENNLWELGRNVRIKKNNTVIQSKRKENDKNNFKINKSIDNEINNKNEINKDERILEENSDNQNKTNTNLNTKENQNYVKDQNKASSSFDKKNDKKIYNECIADKQQTKDNKMEEIKDIMKNFCSLNIH